MIGKTIAGWIYFPAGIIGSLIIGCSLNSGDKFVKYTDHDIVVSRASSYLPVNIVNSQSDNVRYYKRGDSDPILIRPHIAENILPEKKEEKLTFMEVEFKAAVSPESLDDFVKKYAPDELAFVAVQKIAKPYIDEKKWDLARNIYDKYISMFPGKGEYFNKISAILNSSNIGMIVSNLGPGVNSSQGEYAPVISSNGKKLFFARDCGVCGGGEEIFVTNINSSGHWGLAERFGSPISSQRNEVPLAISSDGNIIAVYGNYSGTLGRGDIFHVDKTSDSWTSLQHYPEPLNSEYFDSNAMFSPDGKSLLFVSERPGGIGDFHPKDDFFHGDYDGNTDIYVFVPNVNGGGQVVNLGATINTPYSEYSPFLHPDGKTLYFSSNGHPGLGGLDVFKTTRLRDDSWTDWSEPVNLGKEINTSYNDWGYQFAVNGQIAYFSVGNRPDGYGGSDIYSVSLPGKVQPYAVITVGGSITDPAGNFLSADIIWNDLTLGKEVGHLSSDPQNGEYLIHLPVGGKYSYSAEKAGYIGESESLDLSDEIGYREFIMDIVLHPLSIKSGLQPDNDYAMIRMNNIFFDFDKAELRRESSLELDRWVRMLNENPNVMIEIDGHTDSVGSDIYNQKLSEQRAQSVVDYMFNHGIDPERLDSRGYGEKVPLISNNTGEGRQQNRRVEVKIFKNGR